MKITNCRFCDHILPKAIFKLPDTPLANEFLPEKIEQDKFPLQLTSCNSCHLYQLTDSVDADRLFNKDYTFVSGTSPTNQKYFRKYAEDLIDRFQLKSGDFVVEIASNDGTMLRVFQEYGMKVLGIDPASSIANKATSEGIKTLPTFFTQELADKIINEYGHAKLIIANNMLAHIDNVTDIIIGVKKLLNYDGIFVFENSYFKDVYEKSIFDLIYSEHKSQFLVFPLLILFQTNDMCFFDVQSTIVHGGSIRGFVSKDNRVSDNVDEFIKQEKELGLIGNDLKNTKMLQWQKKIELLSHHLLNVLNIYGKDKVIGYGASAKLTTLSYALGLDKSMLKYIIDDNPLKQNTYSPGKHIPIKPFVTLLEDNPDMIVITAWNFADSIIEKCKSNGYKGKFIVPLPELRIV